MIEINMTNQKFALSTAKLTSNGLQHEKRAGEAYEVNQGETRFYMLNLWALPGVSYFLCRNHKNPTRYTIFAHSESKGEDFKFTRPIGFGTIRENLRNHLELQFTFPRQKVFMCLFPEASKPIGGK